MLPRREERNVPITEKPNSWRFEIETPELGNEDAATTALWEQSISSASLSDDESEASGAEILYDGQSFRFISPLRVEAEARWAGDDLCVSIFVRAAFSSQCSRCLEPADIEILDDFMYLYSLRKKTAANRNGATEETDEEYRIVPVTSWKNRLDISEQVWESLVLSLPMRVLCSRECRGICPTCGKSLNSESCSCTPEGRDPRFEKLLATKFDQDTE